MPSAMVPIFSTTLAAATSSVVMSGIPQIYRDLRLVINYGSSAANDNVTVLVRINGDAGSNYTERYALGTGSSVASGVVTNTGIDNAYKPGNASAAGPDVVTVDFFDYGQTDKQKVTIGRHSDASGFATMYANRWNSTAAITSLTSVNIAGNYTTGSTFNLYGILA